MHNPISRFQLPLQSMEKLVTQSAKQKNQVYWLFQHDLRTPCFQLEGLARIYSSCYERKFFQKLKKRSKTLEDLLGKLDYYAAFEQQLKSQPAIPTEVKLYLIRRVRTCTNDLEQYLAEENWLNGKRILKIKQKLQEQVWHSEEQDSKKIASFFQEEIIEIQEFQNKISNGIQDAETELHEYRRKLRWLSIYAQILQGQIILQPNKINATLLKSYATREILESPYNNLQKNKAIKFPIYLDKSCFYAISWMIKETGRLKDLSLTTNLLHEACNATGISRAKMFNTRSTLAGYDPSQNYLKEADKLIMTFKKLKVLDKLFIGL